MKDCKELPFELREHNDLDETVPSTWHTAFLTAPGAQPAPAAPHWDTLPVCPSLMAGICISCLYENKCYFTLQKFPKVTKFIKNAKVTFSVLPEIKSQINIGIINYEHEVVFFPGAFLTYPGVFFWCCTCTWL